MPYSDLSYTRINWKNRSEALTTPLGKTNLNKMDNMIYDLVYQLSQAYNELNLAKADNATLTGAVVSGVDYEGTTGKFTFSFLNSQQKYVANLNLDKLPIDFSMSTDGVITMVTQGGERYTADISQLIPTFEFLASPMIEFSVETTGKNSVVRAYIKQNSITDQYMQPNYLADITTQANLATAQATLAQGYAEDAAFDADLAKSYSIGDETVREGSSTDNAKYYKEQTEALKTDVEGLKSDTQDILTGAQTIQAAILISEANAKESEQNALTSEENAANSATNAETQALLAESYSSGNESARVGSSTDNAKYYMEQSQSIHDETAAIRDEAYQSRTLARSYAERAETAEANAKESETNAKESETNAADSAGIAKSYRDEAQAIIENQSEILDEIDKKLALPRFSIDNDGNLIYTDDTAYRFWIDNDGNLNYEVNTD